MVSDECPLHDAISLARSSSTTDHLRLNNVTIARIYQNVSELLKEIGGGRGDSILVHLNQTSTNASTLALIVKNEASSTANNKQDMDQQFRMFYVQLADEPAATNGYRLYLKMFIDTFRHQINNVMTTVWSPVTAISKYWRPNYNSQQQQQQNNDQHSINNAFKTFTLPIILRAIDLPSSEQRIIEIEQFEPEQSKSVGNNESKVTIEGTIVQQVAKRILMRAISVFKGHLWAQLPKISSSMLRTGNNGIGVFITDKGVRINLIGEQKSNGDVELYEKKPIE
ncbi:hypothetical protein BLA29_005999 [Euroglyphus maynei]|uniref:Uncharacterized protein n=1 Tax=Euroglyphus maynei TaxID=6958 RepID=A0A1Y3BME0_EURMA|nr:hypothetical protein BLA29_005999 [Euroglyphus maynei]